MRALVRNVEISCLMSEYSVVIYFLDYFTKNVGNGKIHLYSPCKILMLEFVMSLSRLDYHSHRPGTDEWRNRKEYHEVGRCEMDLNTKICVRVPLNWNICSSSFIVTWKCTRSIRSIDSQVACSKVIPTCASIRIFSVDLCTLHYHECCLKSFNILFIIPCVLWYR